MTEPEPVLKSALLDRLPPLWPDETLRRQIANRNQAQRRCVVALDDDPTGTQTVHDIWVLTCWEVDDLRLALEAGESALYILTNSRSLPQEEAQEITEQAAANLAEAARLAGRPVTVVSRSDSTLRGHFPGEVQALYHALSQAEGYDFDGVCLVPFFPEGGRYTVGDVHWVQEGNRLVPAAQTPYAGDPVFGYRHSHLADWVEEKTGGRLLAEQVHSISIETLRCGGPAAVADRLRGISGGAVVIVNAAHDRDLEVFALGLHLAEESGKRFLFRTAASFVKVAAGLPDRPLLSAAELAAGRPPCGGLVVFGSHVPKSTAQLTALRLLPGVRAIELPVPEVLDRLSREAAVAHTALLASQALEAGSDAVIFTSRLVVGGGSHTDNLAIGKAISAALIEVVRGIQVEPRFVIGKGGITCSDLATGGLNLRRARVAGQILPGVPVWVAGDEGRWPGVPYVVFPGNVGDEGAVARVVQALRLNPTHGEPA